MHAYCITGGSRDERINFILKRLHEDNISEIDIVYLNIEEGDEHIKIAGVREFNSRLLLSPQVSKHVVGIIPDANLLTTEAQNALLKLIEEPPPRAIIYLETANRDQLLPTIVSRSAIIQIQGTSQKDNLEEVEHLIEKLLSAKPGEILQYIDECTADRTSAKNWIAQAISVSRAMVLKKVAQGDNQTGDMTKLLRNLIAAQGELEVNVNPKAALDMVFI